jgi:flagellar hook-length control protein FliK
MPAVSNLIAQLQPAAAVQFSAVFEAAAVEPVDFGAVLAAQLGIDPVQALPGAALDGLSEENEASATTTATRAEPVPADPLAAALIALVSPAAPPSAPQPEAIPVADTASERPAARALQAFPADTHDMPEPARAATSAAMPQPQPAVFADVTGGDEPAAVPLEAVDQLAEAVEPVELRDEVQPLPSDRVHDARRPERPMLEAPVRLQARSFPEDLGQRVVWMASNGQHTAELRVDPPQLGPVEVRLTLSGDQANLTLLSSHAAVRDALQSSLPRLQEMLTGIGIDLGSVNVGTHSPGQDRPGESRASPEPPPAWMEPPAGAAGGIATIAVRRGLVDTYA